MLKEVSFYIPAYNAENTIDKAIQSILNQTIDVKEIIVIDDNSSDRTSEIVSRYSDVKLIKNETNLGLGFNRNLAIKECKNDIIASIDADVELDKNWLKILMNKLNQDIIMCGGKMIEKYITLPTNAWRSKYYSQNWGEKDILNPPFLFGCNTILKKKNWKIINGYDESLKTNGEDINFSDKLKELFNVNLFYSSEAKCYHLQNDTLETLSNRIWRYHSYGYKIKKPSILKLIKLTIKQFRFLIIRIFENLIHLNFNFIYISFIIFIKFVKNEILNLITNK